MNLKTRLVVQAGINEDVAVHIVKSLPLSQQKRLCLLDPVELMQELPDLMRDANCMEEFEMDPSYQKSTPSIADALLKTNKHIHTPQLAYKNEPSSGRRYIVYLSLALLLIYCLSSLIPEPEKDNNETIAVTTELKEETKEDRIILPPLPIIVEAAPKPLELPPLPARGSWMFMPDGSFESQLLCNDGRFKDFKGDYCIELWIKKTSENSSEINLIEIIKDQQPVERIFINEDGQFCFSGGAGFPILKHNNPIPTNGQHFHLLVSKTRNTYRIFINGKLKKALTLESQLANGRDGIQILRSISPHKGIAIDEIRISTEAIHIQNFTPERVLSLTATTLLYMPLEKNATNSFTFFASKYYHESEAISGGKWLNIIHETQTISNHLETLRKIKD